MRIENPPQHPLRYLGPIALAAVACLVAACQATNQAPQQGTAHQGDHRRDGGPSVKLTGIIIVNPPVSNPSTTGYGRLQVNYSSTADQAYPTTWQVSQGGAWSPAVAVNPAGSPGYVEKRVGTYQFRINPPAGHTAVAPATITIQQDKLLPIRIRYQ